VHFNHDGRASVRLAVDLVNAPPADPADLARRCADAGLVLPTTVDDAALAGVRRVLEDGWLAVVDAAAGQERAAAVNALLHRWTAAPRMTDHDGSGWHLHHHAAVDVVGQVAALVAVGTALHLVARGHDRLGRCAAAGCERVWADLSRAGRQEYCSARCGNRAAVTRHRERSRARSAGAVRR
jgi:predicted RNA-binding Zn ribbon-like protein